MPLDAAAIVEEIKAAIADTGGRTVTFHMPSGSITDPTQPWLPAASAPGESDTLEVLALPISSAATLGVRINDLDLIKRMDEIYVCPPSKKFNLGLATKAVDGGIARRVVWTETLRPGNDSLLHFVGVER